MEQAASGLVGEVHDVEAIRLNDDGDGVAKVGDLTVFVPGLLPGERARVRITARERRFARAVIENRRTTAAHRRQPECAVFGDCGGCQLQHLDYATQLRHKREVVVQSLARFAGLPQVPVAPTLGMDHPWRYRNQVQVPVEFDGAGHYRLGFFAPRSHRLIATDACHLEPGPLERTIRGAADVIAHGLGPRAAAVHHLIGRYSFTTGEMMLILAIADALKEPGGWARGDGSSEDGARTEYSVENHAALLDDEALFDIAEELLRLPGVVSVARTLSRARHGPVWGRDTRIIAGQSHLTERIGQLEFLISPRSFFQVNTLQARVLYEQVLQYAQVKPTDTVLDAYCGTGTMALLLAERAQSVIGIETVADAVRDAELNARHNRIDNAHFFVGAVEQVLPRLLRDGQRFDVIVLDPPRRGCDPAVLQAVAEASPRRVVYVSCNHATLMRDLRHLSSSGFSVEEVQPIDMFPQTSHVECVTLLTRCSECMV
jgi:23S rRNA (uracil1939-C5)-methyltransferase